MSRLSHHLSTTADERHQRHHLHSERTTLPEPTGPWAAFDSCAVKVGRMPILLHLGEVVVDRYEVMGLLGSGGMGQVFEALDRQLGRRVALKLAWSPTGIESLRLEAAVLAGFRCHDSVVTMYEVGNHGSRAFMIMERLDGPSLADYLRTVGVLPVAEVVRLLRSLCDALAVVHAAGLAHCDLKLSNVMMHRERGAVLIDFGIVRSERNPERRVFSGSPHFMAPETIRGAMCAGEAHLADIYALAVIGFVLLTDRPPYHHPDPMKLMKHELDAPVPHVTTLRPEVPLALDALLAQMMAKTPTERPTSAAHVREALLTLGM